MEDDDAEEAAGEEEGRQTWVEALTQELNDEDEGQEADPDYEVGDLFVAVVFDERGVTSHPHLHLRSSLGILCLVDFYFY